MTELIGMDYKDYTGARWLKVDLHLHSPGVESFKLPLGIDLDSNNDCENLAKEYIKKMEEAQIKTGAITDYNGVRKEWFELIKNKAKDKGVVIFPGVELSLKLTGGKYGLHLLLIFKQNVDIDGLNTFLHSLDKNPQKPLCKGRENRDIESRLELEELISEIRERYKCLVVFPHPEDDKGLLDTFNPSQSAKYLMSVKPDAIEYISEQGKNKLISTNELPSDYFKKIAILENTDPKCLDDIGTKKRDGKLRTTYYKLSSFSIGALKIALHDPEVRVKTYECPSFYHNRISKIVINGSTFLRDIEILFNPELNTFIGGRGVGKSAIIETMRYVMDLPIYADKSFRMDFVESVVGSGGELSVFIERYYGKEKKEFEIKRTIGKDTEIVENGVKTGFSIQSLFEESKYPIIIGQKELYFLSTTPTFQLQLIDELIGKKIQDIQEEFKRLIEQLRENGRRLLVFEKKIDKKETYEQRLKEIESQIKVFKDLGVEGKLRRWTNIVDDEEKLQDAIEKLNGINEKILFFFDESVSELNYLENNLKRGKSENKFILERVAGEISQIEKAFEQSKKRLSEITDQTRKSIEGLYAEWLERKKKVEIEIQKIKKELAEKGLEPDKLEKLTMERAKLKPPIEELTRLEKEIEKLGNDREKSKNKIDKKRHDIFSIRKEQLDKINEALKGRLKIEVKYEEDRDNFMEDLKDLLKGSKVSSDAIEAMVNAPNKVTDGLLLSQYIKGNEQKLREEFNLTQAMSNRILEWFKDSERLYKLETLFPEDKIEIFLKVNEEYKVIDKLSIGQKATALLLLLFAQEDRIVVLDQPEEDLDNRFIYEDVVKILREMKGKRQLFIATHNANIPVLGDSELVLVLDSKNERCVINNKGSIDKEDIKVDVKNIMEGGEEAFRIREEKYGGV
jgi:DNA repair ATPase RecN